MTALQDLNELSPTLFWDVNRDNIDFEKHKSWLISRVLERGTWEDWLLITGAVDNNTLAAMSDRLKIDEKSRNFLNIWLRVNNDN